MSARRGGLGREGRHERSILAHWLGNPYLHGMRIADLRLTFLFVLAMLGPLATASMAQTRHAAAAKHPPAGAAPKSLGTFDDWQAATHAEGGTLVCYAFTRAAASAPALAGRGEVVLTVAQRPGARDTVAISAGFAYATGAAVAVVVDQQPAQDFYTAQRSAFARDGAATVAALHKGRRAVAKSPGPKNTAITDQFSLRGFDAAYAAAVKACPGK